MNQGILFYLLVAAVTHFSVVAGMAILLTIGHSVYARATKTTGSQATATVFRKQINYLFIIFSIALLTGCLPLMVSQETAGFFYRAALLIDIVGPLLVLLQTLRGLKAAPAETGPQAKRR